MSTYARWDHIFLVLEELRNSILGQRNRWYSEYRLQ